MPSVNAKSDYVPEIDGLRAIAIITVVAFHVGLPFFPGGFVGVDIFFVISGFLITRLLTREITERGGLNILNFYARRVRRLFPALGLVVATTLGLGAAVLSPAGDQQELASSAMATAAFASNIYFWRTQTGYFAGPADQLPLLHMWTLAVEEQFYFVWPLTILLVAKVVRRERALPTIAVLLILGSLISLAASWVVTPIKPTGAFYLTPFRAWEFGVGGLLTFCDRFKLPSRFSAALSITGFAAIFTAVLFFDGEMDFPGYAALLPVLGTAATIMGVIGGPHHSPLSKFLRLRPIVTIGQWSYSWYLWHWPLLAIARSATLGDRSLPRDLALSLLALVLAALTYRFVEQPIRTRRSWPFATPARAVLAGLLILVTTAGLGAGLMLTGNIRKQNDPILSSAYAAKEDVIRYLAKANITFPVECTHFKFPYVGLAPNERCTIGGSPKQPMVVLWGDSHAYQLVPALAFYAERTDLRLLPRTMGNCLPGTTSDYISQSKRNEAISCIEFNQDIIKTLPTLKANGTQVVLLAARWFSSTYWMPDATVAHDSLSKLVRTIRQNDISVILVADVPRHLMSIPLCVVTSGPARCQRGRGEVDAERASMLRVLSNVAKENKGVVLWDPISQLCDGTQCPAMLDGLVQYADTHHISVTKSHAMSDALGSLVNTVFADRLRDQARSNNN